MIAKEDEAGSLVKGKKLLKSVMLIIPINSPGQSNEQFDRFLQTEYGKAARQIIKASGLKQHPFIAALITKLGDIRNNTSHAKTIVVYISTNEEQIYYLNYTLSAKIIFNEKFSVITVIKENNKNLTNYMAVVLTGCYARIYKASDSSLKRIVVLAQENCDYSVNDNTKLNCHISSSISRKKQILARYINTIDNTLRLFLDTQPLPVFVLGSHSVANYFSENSNYRFNIVEMFTTNYTDINEEFITGLVGLWAKHHLRNSSKASESLASVKVTQIS